MGWKSEMVTIDIPKCQGAILEDPSVSMPTTVGTRTPEHSIIFTSITELQYLFVSIHDSGAPLEIIYCPPSEDNI